jgi:opacity protein-like surface antigen
MSMTIKALVTAILIAAAPAFAATYPVSGKWGQSASTDQGAIECHGRRVIDFMGNQRTDNKGGVSGYRNVSVRPEGSGYRIVDEFSNGQVNGGRTTFTLRRIDADHIELVMAPGGTLKLQRCK